MKKVILTLAVLIGFALMATAQTEITTLYKASEGQSYWAYNTDVTLSATTAQYIVWNAPQHYFTTQTVTVDVDTTAGTNHTSVAFQLAGAYSSNGDYTNIGSAITWYCTEDTVLHITNTTENGYRLFKLTATGVGAGAVSTIDKIEFDQRFGTP